jgi:hypothetical protein
VCVCVCVCMHGLIKDAYLLYEREHNTPIKQISRLSCCYSTPQVRSLVLFSVRGCICPRTMVRPEGLTHRKISKTPPGTQPATILSVVQCLSLLHAHFLHTTQNAKITSTNCVNVCLPSFTGHKNAKIKY